MIDLFMNRRSIRKFKNIAVEREKLDTIIKGALTSPSGRNDMPWELIVVEDRQKLDLISKLKGEASEYIKTAPLVIGVLADEDKTNLWLEDSSIIASIIQLLAESLDLASCWNHMKDVLIDGVDIEAKAKKLLAIPDELKNLRLLTIIAIGYPDEDLESHRKENLSYDLVHREKYIEKK